MFRKTVRPQTEIHASSTNMRAQQLGKGCGCGVMVLLVVAVVYLGIHLIDTPGRAELGPFVDEYISDTGLMDVSDLNDLYRVGKLVAVDPNNHRLDSRLQKALPADLRAARDDEVGTIVWVTWGEKVVGTYKEAGKYAPTQGVALQGYCEITVIDRAAAVIVERRTFLAPTPPSTTTSKSNVHTKVDVNDIVRYLADLPDELPHAPMPATAPVLVPGSTMTIRLTGPDSGIYSATEAPHCTRQDGNPLDKWEFVDSTIPHDERSLGHLSFSGWLGNSPVDVESATTDLVTTVTIGPISGGRTYVVSTTEGGKGTFSIDDRGVSATITFTGKTASGVFMAWTVECSNINSGP